MPTAGYAIMCTVVCIIYVVPLVIWCSFCRGGYNLLRVVIPCFINVHIPDRILLVYMLSIVGRLAMIK